MEAAWTREKNDEEHTAKYIDIDPEVWNTQHHHNSSDGKAEL